MGIGIIGASSAAAEAFPMGATSVVTEGFSSAPRQDISVSLSPGTYLVNSTSQDGTPVFFYAPNSGATAVAYGDKPAALRITTAETELRITAVPSVLDNPFAKIAFSTGNTSNRSVQILDVDYNPTAGLLAIATKYFDGSSSWRQIWTSTNGVDWSQRFSDTSFDFYFLKYYPEAGVWLAKSGNRGLTSTNGTTWTTGSGIFYEYQPPIYDAATARFIAANENGIYSYTSADNWRTNGGAASSSTGISAYNLVRTSATNYMARYSSGFVFTTNSGTNFATRPDGGDNNQYESFDTSPSGMAHLKGDAVVTGFDGTSSFASAAILVTSNGFHRGGASIDVNVENGIYNGSSNQLRRHRVVGPKEGSDRGVVFGQQGSNFTASIDGVNFATVARLGYKGDQENGFSQNQGASKYDGLNGYLWQSVFGAPNRYGNKFAFKVYSTSFTNL